jgi:hypothetical protein
MFFMRKPKPGIDPRDAVAKAQAGDMHVIDVREHGEVAMSG